ncbi:hypothetical protein D3C72_2137860 [compost metagenome]
MTSVCTSGVSGQNALPSPHQRPIGIDRMVVRIMPAIIAPGTLRTTRPTVRMKPAMKVRVTGLNVVNPTIVSGLATMNLAFSKPISAMNRPMPQAMP